MASRFQRNPLVRALASVHLMLVLTLIFAIASGAATIIESRQGTPAARALVYNATWFELVMGLLVLNLILLLFARMPYRRSQYGFVIVHLSIIVILVSSGITRFFGYEGIMPIREGQSTDYLLSSKEYVQLGNGEASAAYPVLLYDGGSNRVSKNLELGGERYRVAVTGYWEHYEESIGPAETGRPAVEFASVGERGMERRQLFAGQDVAAGSARVEFLRGGFGPARDDAPLGTIQIHVGEKSANLAVSRDAQRSVELAGHSFRVVEFHADYAKRGETPPPTEMLNPMAAVEITGPNGETARRLLFAFFPDFSMSHGGEDDPFPALHLEYSYGRLVELAAVDGALHARGNFPLEVVDMASGEVASIRPAGAPFELEPMVLHRSGDFSLVLTEFWESAALQPGSSDDPNAPSAARLEVVAADGTKATALCRRGAAPRRVQLGDRSVTLAYGPQVIKLPYRLHLDDFQLHTYPGSNNPASYESHVRVYDEEHGVSGRPVRIYMNHPLTYRGYKHFQSSYDPDRLGTVLSVNHDPGKWPTYIGYIMIGVGFVMLLFRGKTRDVGSAASKEAA